MQLLYRYCLCLKALVQLQQWRVSYSFESNTKPWHALDTFLSVALRLHVEICFHKERGPFLPARNTCAHSPRSGFLGIYGRVSFNCHAAKNTRWFPLTLCKRKLWLVDSETGTQKHTRVLSCPQCDAHARTRRKASGTFC